jgi:nucleotide-binding universal stress UspA family protein
MKLLVCYDGSGAAREALNFAQARAKMFDGKIFVVTAMTGGPEVTRKEFQEKEEELEKVKHRLAEEQVTCETTLSVRGLEPGEDLVLFAKEHSIDEIIIGVEKRSKVGKFIFGSTAQYVILEAPCPVLTVKDSS